MQADIQLLLKREHYKKLDLRVIAMSGYRRDRFGDEYSGFHFISPSPNIKSVTAATLYPATVFLEATRVSEGRGSEAPFEQFGAPFINPQKLLLALRAYALPGVVFDPVSFTPLSGKFRGERCQGLKLTVTSRQLFRPFRTAAAILLALQQLYSEQLGLQEGGEFFDKLAGTPRFREMILRQMELETIMEESARQIAAFNQERALDRLYP